MNHSCLTRNSVAVRSCLHALMLTCKESAFRFLCGGKVNDKITVNNRMCVHVHLVPVCYFRLLKLPFKLDIPRFQLTKSPVLKACQNLTSVNNICAVATASTLIVFVVLGFSQKMA